MGRWSKYVLLQLVMRWAYHGACIFPPWGNFFREIFCPQERCYFHQLCFGKDDSIMAHCVFSVKQDEKTWLTSSCISNILCIFWNNSVVQIHNPSCRNQLLKYIVVIMQFKAGNLYFFVKVGCLWSSQHSKILMRLAGFHLILWTLLSTKMLLP